MTITTKAKDGSYGPFHFYCNIDVKDGEVTLSPIAPEDLELVVDGDNVSLQPVVKQPDPPKAE